jgi:uncharacterized ion transporter superfamily protein YfcC
MVLAGIMIFELLMVLIIFVLVIWISMSVIPTCHWHKIEVRKPTPTMSMVSSAKASFRTSANPDNGKDLIKHFFFLLIIVLIVLIVLIVVVILLLFVQIKDKQPTERSSYGPVGIS